MLIAGMAALTATASKWLLVGKIMATLGSGLCTAAPLIDKLKKGKEKQ